MVRARALLLVLGLGGVLVSRVACLPPASVWQVLAAGPSWIGASLVSWNAVSYTSAGFLRRRLGGAGMRSRGKSAIASRASSRSFGGRSRARFRVSRESARSSLV